MRTEHRASAERNRTYDESAYGRQKRCDGIYKKTGFQNPGKYRKQHGRYRSEHRTSAILYTCLLYTSGCGACVPVCPAGLHSISAEGEHRIDRSKDCLGCHKCTEACLYSALEVAGEQCSISELLEYVEEDRAFYEQSGGGVTLGGGEVTSQPEAAINLLMACKQEGFHTAIETCGYTKKDTILKFAEFVDLFLFDIKHIDPDRHFELTGVRNEMILENLKELLHRRKHVKIRMPMLKDINDSEAEIRGVIEFLMPYKDYKNFEGIDLLPYRCV